MNTSYRPLGSARCSCVHAPAKTNHAIVLSSSKFNLLEATIEKAGLPKKLPKKGDDVMSAMKNKKQISNLMKEVQKGKVGRRDFLRKVVALGASSATAYSLLNPGSAEAQQYQLHTTFAVGEETSQPQPIQPTPVQPGPVQPNPVQPIQPNPTTLALGEEGNLQTTLAVGEESQPKPPPKTTYAVGEEASPQPIPNPTTQAIGEENIATTFAVGEETQPIPNPTTRAVGEENIGTTYAVGEESQPGCKYPSTTAYGEETNPRPTTQAVGEETQTLPPNPPTGSTAAYGEETNPRPTTQAIGEEVQTLPPNPPTTQPKASTRAMGEEGSLPKIPFGNSKIRDQIPKVWKNFRRW